MNIIISGITVEVFRKNIKHMHLYVKPDGRVTVSAPFFVSDGEIERFIRIKEEWIKEHIERSETRADQSRIGHVSGETMHVWGRRYRLQVNHGSKNSIVLSGDDMILTVREESSAEKRESFVREWYREQTKARTAELLPKWEMITGLKCSGWQTKYMTTRWGTCNTRTRKIWLNPQLAKRTPECLEYVILHELIHIIEKGHNERFYSLMSRYMPKWKDIKRSLNAQTLGTA